MSAYGSGPENLEWFVEPDRGRAAARPRRSPRAGLDDERANSIGIVIITSLLFALLAAALMVGGHAAIAPMLRSAIATGNPTDTGSVVLTMPDRVFCRRMSIDNLTGDMTQGALEHCPNDIVGKRPSAAHKFEWGTH